MPDVFDLINGDAFSLHELSSALEKVPFEERRLGQMGMFDPEPLASRFVNIDIGQDRVHILNTRPVGSAPQRSAKPELHNMVTFQTPHIPVEDRITANEIQDLRRLGEVSQRDFAQVVNRRLTRIRNDFESTFEMHRLNALRGKLLDADGSVLLDLFSRMGVSQQTTNMQLSTSATDVRGKIVKSKRKIEDALGGVTTSGMRVIAGRDFFDAFVQHPNVRDTYVNQEGNVLREDLRDGFTFGGVTIEEYRGFEGLGGVGKLADSEALMFPVGVPDMYRVFWGPADNIDDVNTLGRPFTSRLVPDEQRRKFIDIYAESNPLVVNTRPNAVVKLKQNT